MQVQYYYIDSSRKTRTTDKRLMFMGRTLRTYMYETIQSFAGVEETFLLRKLGTSYGTRRGVLVHDWDLQKVEPGRDDDQLAVNILVFEQRKIIAALRCSF